MCEAYLEPLSAEEVERRIESECAKVADAFVDQAELQFELYIEGSQE